MAMAAAALSENGVTSLESIFNIRGKSYSVTCTTEALSWNASDGKAVKGGVSVPVAEILSVAAGPGPANREALGSLTVVYVQHRKGGLLRSASVTFTGDQRACTSWCTTLQALIHTVAGRPRRALVLVNPVSGRSKGPKVYESTVAPVFKTADLKTDVIVSESADHVLEVIRTYDMSKIDSVVVVGGDGMYHLVADALIRRDMEEAGLDINNSETDIPDLSKPIGIIPCGTGNGIARGCYGNYDIETAALAIVIGGVQRSCVFGIWSAGELMVYCFMQQNLGMFADLIYESERRRHLGIWRYAVAIGQLFIWGPVRTMDLTIEIKAPNLPNPSTEQQKTKDRDTGQATDNKENDSIETLQKTENDKAEGKSEKLHEQEMKKDADLDLQNQQWQTHRRRYTDLSVFFADLIGYKLTKNPAYLTCSRLILTKEWSRIKMAKMFAAVVNMDSGILRDENFDMPMFVEYKVRVNDPEGQRGRATFLNVDGELFRLKAPEYHCRFFPEKIRLFSSITKEYILNM